ncbi:MAG: HRDC domain-containing protein, partial [Gaiella sp.]
TLPALTARSSTRARAGRASTTGADAAVDGTTFAALRAWRAERSRADGVPAYVVLHDATLRELASARPSSVAELAGVPGLGPVKLERYGDDLLAVLAAV